MDAHRFDALTRSLGARFSRRSVLQRGGVGVTAAIGGAEALGVAAQDATPEPEPQLIDASFGGNLPTFLYTQAFQGGTWEPVEGEADLYLLTLIGAPPQTIYFSDRPNRLFGTAPTQEFLDRLGFTAENPPNAAIVVETAGGGEDVLVIELFDPAYDDTIASLTYYARVVSDYRGEGLAHVSVRQDDFELATPFGPGGLFIDSGEQACSDVCPGCKYCVITDYHYMCGSSFRNSCDYPCNTSDECTNAFYPECLLGIIDAEENTELTFCESNHFCTFIDTCQVG